MRLDQRKGLKEFVHGAISARKDDDGGRVFQEHDLPAEKMAEAQKHFHILVCDLLEWQLDVEPDGISLRLVCPLVGSFHDTASAAGDHSVSVFNGNAGDLFGQYIVLIVLRGTRGPEDRDARPGLGKSFEAFHEFGHDAENPPGVFVGRRYRSFRRHKHVPRWKKKITSMFHVLIIFY